MCSDDAMRAFQKTVYAYYRKHGRRHLPWRKTKSAYKILVSEVMLQQTQVPRVIEKYGEFLSIFPTPHALADAPLSAVLALWQGLGYNRRAKALHNAGKEIVLRFKGRVPKTEESLTSLPGVGTYTARAVMAFAFNLPVTFLETNVRSVFIHHFFPDESNVTDDALVPYVEKALDTRAPRRWYSALMDYGTHIKKTNANPSRQSAHHTRQAPFQGSDRQIRGAIIRTLVREGGVAKEVLCDEIYSTVAGERR